MFRARPRNRRATAGDNLGMCSPLKFSCLPRHPRAAADPTPEAIGYLNEHEPVLRVGFPNSPNMGHQTATLETARRLRQLGYTGTLELVCGGRNVPESRRKLDALLPSLVHSAAPAAANVQVVNAAYAHQQRRRVAVVCGSEVPDGVAREFNVEVALVLQPLQWPQQRGIARPETFQPLNHLPADSALWLQAPEPTALSLRQHLPPQEARRDTLLAVAQRQQVGCIDLQVAYSAYRAPCGGRRAVERLSLAIQGAQKHTHAPNPVLPTVLLLVQNPDSPILKRCGVAAEDPQAWEQLASPLRDAGVALLTCSTLPEPVFRALFAQSSLPPVLEGANTTNLMRRLQKPYLSFNTAITPFPERFPNDPQAQQAEAASGTFGLWSSTGSVQALTQALLGARRPGPMLDYFTEIGARSHDPRNDQVSLGLHALHQSLQPRRRGKVDRGAGR